MPSKLSVTIAASALAASTIFAVAPPATATPAAPPAGAGVTVKIPAAAAGALGESRQALVDAVTTDALGRSHDGRGLAPSVAVGKLAEQGREVVVDVRSATSGWARGVAYVEAPATSAAHPEGWLFIARYEDGRWVSGVEGDGEFAEYVSSSPLVGAAERRSMTAYANHQSFTAAANTGGLLLPWMPNYYMTVTGGPHAWDGVNGYWSSLDFAGGNASGRVRSSREGTATSMCGAGGGWTRVIHPNGFSTDYYHMYNATYYNGTAVGSSALLGTIGRDVCAGGRATGDHVHWGLRTYDANYNGTYTWLHGRTIGGWAWWNGSSQYSGCATRLGVTACPGTAIYNRTS
ncbi:M23 family metallopeptidase [Kribbella shirazensis]|uniref:Murein DD-endopeptidase MepM/ murein hydrolase activator NlpD n=1 Tax=Kribbella shirazensis TaxID=1105143 RepID=A0A7X5VJR8_9ACTN|nr:M23 family metallopeptidase [Kribbella shirazensis]NIK62503.1 murein DD-endopeptidase MepM/ murein hydrolase activator NlpD [Kribbella shirazensis]